MYMWASEKVFAGIYTLLCMLGPLIKRDKLKEERIWRVWSRSESLETSEVPSRNEAWTLNIEMNETGIGCDECD